MLAENSTIRCDGCGAELLLSPVKVGTHIYCCKDCSEGLKCTCGANMDLEQSRRARSYEENPESIEP
jgi:hypothetical protein